MVENIRCNGEHVFDEFLGGDADVSTRPKDISDKNHCFHIRGGRGGEAHVPFLSAPAEKRNSIRRGVFSFICRAACLVAAGAIALRAFQ